MILASHQPLLFPWLGYFDKMRQADLFILSDNVQFSKNNYQHRNRIVCAQTPQQWRWLSVPVRTRSDTLIKDVQLGRLEGDDWREQHLRLLTESYRAAAHFDWLMPKLEAFYARPFSSLADVTVNSVRFIANLLDIDTPIRLASSFGPRPADRTERLVMMCRAAGADTYLCGMGGSKAYIDRLQFKINDITLRCQTFNHPHYPQTVKPFVPFLSALDLLFNCGPHSRDVFNGGIQ